MSPHLALSQSFDLDFISSQLVGLDLRCHRFLLSLPHRHESSRPVSPFDPFHRPSFFSSSFYPSHQFIQTTSITLTLLFRSVGAVSFRPISLHHSTPFEPSRQVVFGLISDRYGRKWPLVANLFLVSVLSLGTGFVQSFQQFLALRSLFGVGMGGIWGLASATALENLPVEARGLASGVLQQGYAAGYLIAAVVNLYLVPKSSWRALFWTGAGISAFAGVLRALLPESEFFRRAKQERQNNQTENTKSKTRIFFHEVKQMLKHHWMLSIYAVLLMTGFNFLSHGSQDLYPTYLQVAKDFTKFNSTVATIIGNCGAISYVFLPLSSVVVIIIIFIPIQWRNSCWLHQPVHRSPPNNHVSPHSLLGRFYFIFTSFPFPPEFSSSSLPVSSHFGSSPLPSASFLQVLSAFNSASKGKFT